jgi:hypothetical protein
MLGELNESLKLVFWDIMLKVLLFLEDIGSRIL